ncbi:hypothetical protein [Mycolicibacterium aichiense]|uniref:Uncharacterized protein n=1 Tax=Mycolicibacterium aichiense TaxID=1799 RepID=A0AAD1HJU2_9MYCO|nr:hypothetical protein [Mycolicibacterium aichiense]MCV7017686.1 hypothetical protein [Mycolicibacterium aichiense]BBX06703.1 hypothetical protein MAIC_15060 [Mycolicibacterium aichiense]
MPVTACAALAELVSVTDPVGWATVFGSVTAARIADGVFAATVRVGVEVMAAAGASGVAADVLNLDPPLLVT